MLAVLMRLREKKVPLKILLFYLLYFVVVLAGVLYSGENLPYIKDIMLNQSFIKYSLLFSAAFIFEDTPDVRIRQLTVISLVTLLVFQLGISKGVFLDDKGRLEYMAVGYGCAPWWIFIAQGILYYKNKLIKLACLLFAVYFAFIIAVYGNRGALLVIALAALLGLIVYLPPKRLAIVGTGIAAVLTLTVLFLEPLLKLAGRVLHMDLTLSRNFRLLDSGMLTYDSGRQPIYQECWNAVVNRPLLGYGAGGDRLVTTGHGYAHNMVLELCISLGVLVGLLVFCWLLYLGFRMLFCCRDRAWTALFFPFYVFSMIELFFSGSVYESGWLMAAIVIFLTCSTYHTDVFRKPVLKERRFAHEGCLSKTI
ncbi:MAG: hypothetical protein GXW99_11605 [Clostridiales bacterium]|nr:hypothetical protein [Clostridiales bacterium]